MYNISVNSCTYLYVVCRVLRPPGGGSSNLFGGYEEDTSASRRPNKMSSSIFAPPEDTQGSSRRSNPPGELSADSVFCLGPLALCEWKSSLHCYLVLCVRDSLSSTMQTGALCMLSCHEKQYQNLYLSLSNQSVNFVRSYTDWPDEIRHLEQVKGHSDKTLAALSQATYWSEV